MGAPRLSASGRAGWKVSGLHGGKDGPAGGRQAKPQESALRAGSVAQPGAQSRGHGFGLEDKEPRPWPSPEGRESSPELGLEDCVEPSPGQDHTEAGEPAQAGLRPGRAELGDPAAQTPGAGLNQSRTGPRARLDQMPSWKGPSRNRTELGRTRELGPVGRRSWLGSGAELAGSRGGAESGRDARLSRVGGGAGPGRAGSVDRGREPKPAGPGAWTGAGSRNRAGYRKARRVGVYGMKADTCRVPVARAGPKRRAGRRTSEIGPVRATRADQPVERLSSVEACPPLAAEGA